jgi:protein NrfD
MDESRGSDGQGMGTGPYGRRTDRVPGTILPIDQHGSGGQDRKRRHGGPPTYYDQPVVKHSHYGWLIISYLFLGGLAGAAQIIATLADLLGSRHERSVVRAGRYLALAGSLASPGLLIADLQFKQRWFNMLRIFRPTSPMSIGSWTLAAFGTFSGLAALGQILEDLFGLPSGRRLARWSSLPAAGAGAVMSIYTGSLLSATSTPLWAVGYRHLPPLFGATAFSTAAAVLTLALRPGRGSSAAIRRLDWVGVIGGLAQLVVSRSLDHRWQASGLSVVPERPGAKLAYEAGVQGLGMGLPLLIQLATLLSGRELPRLTILAAVATLLGGFAERSVIVFGGNRSAEQPRRYFDLAQPGSSAASLRPTLLDESARLAWGSRQ